VKSGLDIVPVSRMDEVLTHALIRRPEPIDWSEAEEAPAKAPAGEEDGAGAMVAH
jgi:ATP-dependent Lon protease